jgi:predicted P-loop ATPase
MAPDFDQFAEIDLQNRDADLSRLMKGKLIGEIAELRGLQQRDAEAIKAFVTSRYEEWTPKYVEKPVRYLRRIVLIGTTNDEEFLGPHTGERRWLPIRIVDGDVIKIASDRDQLWAEAATLAQSRASFGDDPVLWEKAFELGAAEREPFKVEDLYYSKLAGWLRRPDGKSSSTRGFTSEQAMMDAGISIRGTPWELSRVSRALRALGFVQKRQRAGERRPRIWFPEELEKWR